MVWLQVDDIELLRNPDPQILREAIDRDNQYEGIDTPFLTNETKFVVEPTDIELLELIKGELRNKKQTPAVVLSFRLPEDTIFKNNHPFMYLKLRSKHFPMKMIEKRSKVKKEVVLSERLGFTIYEPNYGFEKIAGNYRLKEYMKRLFYLRNAGFSDALSALMFFGTAGSGKTHVAEAIAKEFGYKFGYLDLPHFMTLPSPTQAIDTLFDFLQEQEYGCVLLIDEIEKMFDFEGRDLKSKNVFGKLLTRLNNIYNDPDNKIIFIATANNISDIVKYVPEFMRKGRFDEIFFLSYPDEKSAKAIIQLFINKVQAESRETIAELLQRENVPDAFRKIRSVIRNREDVEAVASRLSISISADEVYDAVEAVYPDAMKVSDDEEFIYSPPEINTIIKELQNKGIYELLVALNEEENHLLDIDEIADIDELLLKNDDEMMEAVIAKINPLQVSASSGIKRQIAQAENYRGDSRHESYQKG